MPTFERLPQFNEDLKRLTREQRVLVNVALRDFIQDVDSGDFRASLRVHALRGHRGIHVMCWEGNDGRATFSYGPEKQPGKRHIIWRRIESHTIYENP